MTETFTLAGHRVKRVGFGAMQLPGPGVFGPPKDHAAALATLRRAVELGINHIDTAQFYGPGVSNRLIAEALRPYPENLVLVSKVGARRDDQGNWLPNQQPEQLKEDARRNLETLKVDRLPVINLRVMPKEEGAPQDHAPYEDQLQAMRELVDEGTIEAFGVSTVDLAQAKQGLDAGAVCVQNAYNLLSRDDDPVLDLCTERGVAYVPYFPLGSAFPGMPKVTEDERVVRIARQRDITPSQVGLAWLLARAENILLIPGTSSVAHLEENTAVGGIRLTEAELAELG